MSERVRHAMMVVREASSFVPEIGTTDTSDKTICFANRQYRQHIVVRSADVVCTARDAIGRCCQWETRARALSDLRMLVQAS